MNRNQLILKKKRIIVGWKKVSWEERESKDEETVGLFEGL